MDLLEGIRWRPLPDQAGVKLWIVEGRGNVEDREALFETLSSGEKERISRFTFDDARNAAIVSRGVLRRILGEELECAPESLEFGVGEHGKPFLAGGFTGSRVEFNVAHSGDLVLYAVSQAISSVVSLPESGTNFQGRIVGVDVELIKESLDVENLAARYFAPVEVTRLLEDGSAENRIDNFYRCWTRKEAYLKARGTGLTTKLDAFAVTLLPDETPALLHTEVSGEDAEQWTVQDVAVPEGYHAALVVGP